MYVWMHRHPGSRGSDRAGTGCAGCVFRRLISSRARVEGPNRAKSFSSPRRLLTTIPAYLPTYLHAVGTGERSAATNWLHMYVCLYVASGWACRYTDGYRARV